MAGVTAEQAHRFARERGVSRPLYLLAWIVMVPLLRLYFRVRISGAQHLPKHGAAIIVPNHKDFWDAFFVAIATRRHVRFMTASETLRGVHGYFLVRLGAFPVKRGQSDDDAVETARIILSQGGLLALFPEGTTIPDAETVGEPHQGAARLALELRDVVLCRRRINRPWAESGWASSYVLIGHPGVASTAAGEGRESLPGGGPKADQPVPAVLRCRERQPHAPRTR